MTITIPPENPIAKIIQFDVFWFDRKQPALMNTIVPPTFNPESGATKLQPPLYSMIALEVWRIFVNKVKDWLAPEAAEPDEED